MYILIDIAANVSSKCTAAQMSAVFSEELFSSTDAPALSSTSTTAEWPCKAAYIKGVPELLISAVDPVCYSTMQRERREGQCRNQRKARAERDTVDSEHTVVV